jgi:hypothetical protein
MNTKTKIKAVLSLMVLLTICVAHTIFASVSPEISTSLALEQFKNPSIATDTASRFYNGSGSLWPFLYLFWFIWNSFMFFQPLGKKESV